jgi:hypothetical protein
MNNGALFCCLSNVFLRSPKELDVGAPLSVTVTGDRCWRRAGVGEVTAEASVGWEVRAEGFGLTGGGALLSAPALLVLARYRGSFDMEAGLC